MVRKDTTYTPSVIGHLLVSFARRVSSEDLIDPSALFSIPSILSENNPSRINVRWLLSCIGG